MALQQCKQHQNPFLAGYITSGKTKTDETQHAERDTVDIEVVS